jgi:transcriptional regulator with XRE-family HTH domain
VRLRCHLREFRGKRTLKEIAAGSGVSMSVLSQLERGRMVPTDHEVAALEREYGKAIEFWYPPRTLIAFEQDVEDEAA